MYNIRYNYDTGDSFNTSHGVEDILEFEWKSEKKAQENLKRIEEHYDQYRLLNSYENRYKKWEEIQELLDRNYSKDWFVYKERLMAVKDGNWNAIDKQYVEKFKEAGYEIKTCIDTMDAKNCIILYTDDDKPLQFWCPWCGYFESLNEVEVITVGNTENKISFR